MVGTQPRIPYAILHYRAFEISMVFTRRLTDRASKGIERFQKSSAVLQEHLGTLVGARWVKTRGLDLLQRQRR